uniref:Solute carrier family 28 member 3 n=1 Tax=Neogobius melanostomus TaxID=47308 RepID=A0A8C6TAP7_9GOBI
ACVVNFQKASILLIITCVVVLCFLWDLLFKRYGSLLWDKLSAGRTVGRKKKLWIKRYLMRSRNEETAVQRRFFTFMHVLLFMSFSDAGAEFVFGPNFADHLFAFKVEHTQLGIKVFISLSHVSFHAQIGFIMQLAVGASPAESLAAAGNIFLGQTESILLIRPYISRLTCSEIHAVMTGGFASISGTVLGSYIAFGVDPAHLLTASVMSSPASLATAKTLWPETESSQILCSLLEAACRGASSAIEVVANILVNIISCLALLALMDSVLSWVGSMFDCPAFSFTLICSYVFMPLSFMMGVSWEDSFIVADLIGKKTFINEFVAYQKLSEFIRKRKGGGAEYVGNVKQYLSERSETIATYALCGFSNVTSLAMLVGALSKCVCHSPGASGGYQPLWLRSLIAGCVSCFMTACIAGILYIPDVHCPDYLTAAFNGSVVNNSSQLLDCCSRLYDSVAGQGQINLTLGPGFTLSSLRGCCDLSPHTRVNCSASPASA